MWKKAWKDLEQWRIQRWIERIPRHIQEIIRLKGGNEYRKGSSDTPRRTNAPDHEVPQNNWEDILDIKEEEDELQLKEKAKPKPQKHAPKKATVKSAAGTALAAIFAILDGQETPREPCQEPPQEPPQELPEKLRRVLRRRLPNEVLNERFIGPEEPLQQVAEPSKKPQRRGGGRKK